MEKKKLLIAASPSIPSAAIRHYLPDLPEAWNEQDIAFLEGNSGLKNGILARWPAAAPVYAKSRSAIRALLDETAHLVLLWDGEDLTKLLFEARLQGVPTKVIPVEITRVVNKTNTDQYDVYIGRGTIWGNPFAIGHGDGPDRADVIRRYQEYFNEKLETDPAFKRGVLGLRGLRLACFCKPQACHGDVIAAYLDQVPGDWETSGDMPKE
nr:DUF4326 domain-containing protein [uncultured Rhodoferax sp.]